MPQSVEQKVEALAREAADRAALVAQAATLQAGPKTKPPRWFVRTVQVVAFMALALVFGLVAIRGIHANQLGAVVAANQQANTRALCAMRSDLQNRVDTASELLMTHPRGIAGIPAAVIQTTIVNEQHTIKALSPLSCS